MKREDARKESPISLTDRDRTHDLLLMEKSLSTAYFMAARECANQDLRAELEEMCKGPSQMHARVFHAMHERNWYQTPTAGQQAIESDIIKWEQQQVRNPELHP
jgi:spore coat protein CotF